MEENRQYLEFILEKLRERIAEIDETLEEGAREIQSMNEYYWENYTEMDELGYENFDNQQALFTRINANQDQLALKFRFRKMLDSPYFGRVDFIYEGEEEPETYYIGIGNFSETTGGIPLVFDWRAPVSGLFYDYDKGPARFEAPGGTMIGEVASKWQYKIKNGRLVYAFESDTKIDDEILKRELGANGDVKLKSIVRTIQREQNAIIRNTKDRIMVIQGVAGSGKTSIALHRIAYLLYHDRKNLRAEHVLILSPNSVFSDYISHILPELGEEPIREMSFDFFAWKELKGIAEDCEDKYDEIEYLLQKSRRKHSLSADDKAAMTFGFSDARRLKQSPAYVTQINGFLLGLEDELMCFRDFDYKKIHKTAREIQDLFYNRFPDIPILSRMKAVMEYIVDEAETLEGKTYDELELAIIDKKFMSMYETQDIYEIYNRFLESMGLRRMPDLPLEKRCLRYEDVYPLLYMKYNMESRENKKQVRHLIVDEMQDYSYVQYCILQMLFPCKMTIVGDRLQTMDERAQNVMEFLPKIFGREIRMLTLNKSYRNTVEIASYARQFSDGGEMELLERHGKEPEEVQMACLEEAVEHLLEHIRLDGFGNSAKQYSADYETAALLTMSEREAKEAYAVLKEMMEKRGLDVQKRLAYLDRDSSRFPKGIVVTTFYLAKGLEFDQVFALCRREDNRPIHRQAKYICATRALHELYFYKI